MAKKADILLIVGIGGAALLSIVFLLQSTGSVTMDTPGARLLLHGRLPGSVVVRPGTAEVRARKYRPADLTLTRDHAGATWQLRSNGPWGQLETVTIKPHQTTAIALGPPLVITPNVNIRRRQVSVGLSIVGRAGEKYRNIIEKNAKRNPAPTVQIRDEAGGLLASGRFKYG